jgi:hypothetical protein
MKIFGPAWFGTRPVAWQQERISREPRLTGGVPLGLFMRRSIAHQILVGWR